MKFTDYGLKAGIIRALDEMNYTEPTEIQSQVIPLALEGHNIVGQSQTGTGKTAAFLLPLLHNIDTNKKGLQALILAPTRELVNQIEQEIFALTKYYRVNAVCVYGGASPVIQKKNLSKGPSIIVATPGRLLDFVNQRVVDLRNVDFLVLDEVDRMLDMGFVRDIKKLRALMKQIKQTFTFSATISDDIKKIIYEYIPTHKSIKVGEAVTVDKINHMFVAVPHQDKIANLLDILQGHRRDKIVIFTQTKRNTKTLLQIIQQAGGYSIGMLNGDMKQGKRNSTLKAFTDNELKILVTTDVAARGLNMDNVNLVINFDVPKEAESYIHRIGRTGRAGAEGKALMLVSPEEHQLLADIEKMHRTRVKPSDHIVVVDTAGTHAHHRLDKSTDKFGKGRANPNQSRGGSSRTGGRSDSGSRSRSSAPRTGGSRDYSDRPAGPRSSSTSRTGEASSFKFGAARSFASRTQRTDDRSDRPARVSPGSRTASRQNDIAKEFNIPDRHNTERSTERTTERSSSPYASRERSTTARYHTSNTERTSFPPRNNSAPRSYSSTRPTQGASSSSRPTSSGSRPSRPGSRPTSRPATRSPARRP